LLVRSLRPHARDGVVEQLIVTRVYKAVAIHVACIIHAGEGTRGGLTDSAVGCQPLHAHTHITTEHWARIATPQRQPDTGGEYCGSLFYGTGRLGNSRYTGVF
jgi:hypothetical protein